MDVQLFLLPYDSGRPRWRCGAGPEHLLRAGLSDHLRSRGHSVHDIQVIEDDPSHEPAEIRTTFELARRLAVRVRAAHAAGQFSLVLSGNCFSALGTVSGLSPSRRAVFWFDAHGDYNTPETTTSGFLDGMGLTAVNGLSWQQLAATVPGFQPVEPSATFLLGVRDLDPPEAELVRAAGVSLIPVEGLPHQLRHVAGPTLSPDTVGYLHLDLDVLDPSVGRANYLPVPGGLTVPQLSDTIRVIRKQVSLRAACLASYAPEEDTDRGVARAAFAAVDAILPSGG